MQFIMLLVAFWMPILLALTAGVTAAPIPNASIASRSEVVKAAPVLEERTPEPAPEPAADAWKPITAYRREAHTAHRRQSRMVRKRVGSLDKRETSALFPVSGALKSWTTSSGGSSALSKSKSSALPLSNSVFRAQKDNGMPHEIETAPDGSKAMVATYGKGTYTLTHGSPSGFSFYAPGPESVDLTTAKEATFGYSVFFPEGFNWVKGGKLPGLYGGDSDEEAVSCSGGRRDNGCFSARFMWRKQGAGEFYTYLPPDLPANNKVCTVAPYSECNPKFGASVGRGAFTFATGAWTTVTERIKLNDADQANGEIELFVNGESVINVTGLQLRDKDAGRIRGAQMQTFFGGGSSDFATPSTQKVYFRDFSASITELLADS